MLACTPSKLRRIASLVASLDVSPVLNLVRTQGKKGPRDGCLGRSSWLDYDRGGKMIKYQLCVVAKCFDGNSFGVNAKVRETVRR